MNTCSVPLVFGTLILVVLAVFVQGRLDEVFVLAQQPPQVQPLPEGIYNAPKRENAPEVNRFVKSFVPVLSTYDGSDEWHAGFAWYTDWVGTYRTEKVDQEIGFIRGQAVKSVTYDSYINEAGNKFWSCKIIFEPAGDGWPVILDVTFIQHRDGTYRINWMARDWC